MGKMRRPKISQKAKVEKSSEISKSTRSRSSLKKIGKIDENRKFPCQSDSNFKTNFQDHQVHDRPPDARPDGILETFDDVPMEEKISASNPKLKRKLAVGTTDMSLEQNASKIDQKKKKKKRKNNYPPIIKISKRKTKSRSKKKITGGDKTTEGFSINQDCNEGNDSIGEESMSKEMSIMDGANIGGKCKTTGFQHEILKCLGPLTANHENANDFELLEDTIILNSELDESLLQQKGKHALKITATSESSAVNAVQDMVTEVASVIKDSLQSVNQQNENSNMLCNMQETVLFSNKRDAMDALHSDETTSKLKSKDKTVDPSHNMDVYEFVDEIEGINESSKTSKTIALCGLRGVCSSDSDLVHQNGTGREFSDEGKIVDCTNKKKIVQPLVQFKARNNLENHKRGNRSRKTEIPQNPECPKGVEDGNLKQPCDPAQYAQLPKEVNHLGKHDESIGPDIKTMKSSNHILHTSLNSCHAKPAGFQGSLLDYERVDRKHVESKLTDEVSIPRVDLEHKGFSNPSDEDRLHCITVSIGNSDENLLKSSDASDSITNNNNTTGDNILSMEIFPSKTAPLSRNKGSIEDSINTEVALQCIDKIFHEPDEEETREKTISVKVDLKSKDLRRENSSWVPTKRVKLEPKPTNHSKCLKKSPKKEIKSQPLNQYVYNENDELSCRICMQKLDTIKFYTKSFENGLDEDQAILDPQLQLFSGNEEEVMQEDLRASNKLTNFSIYCKTGHLCPIDSGLIQKDIEIYFSGYIKPIFSDDPSLKGGVPGKDFGPIVHWWITGFDLGEQPTIGLTTEIGDYILMEPSEEYSPFMTALQKKILLSKAVIECLIYEPHTSYEDLMRKLQSETLLNVTEDALLDHARFICDQVVSFDETAKPGEALLVVAPCIRRLIELSGIKLSKQQNLPPRKLDDQKEQSRRTLTEHNRNSTSVSADELIDRLLPASTNYPVIRQKGRCRSCERCCRPPCRNCDACNQKKFDQCRQRRCFYYEIKEANDEDWRNSFDHSQIKVDSSITVYKNTIQNFQCFENKLSWIGPSLGEDENGNIYYKSATVNNVEISCGDFVAMRSVNQNVPAQVVKVAYLWQNSAGIAQFHGIYLWPGRETVLGKLADERELFFINNCQNLLLASVFHKVHVDLRSLPKCWDGSVVDESGKTFFCHKSYDPKSGCFTDLILKDANISSAKSKDSFYFCQVCEMDRKKREFSSPQPFGKFDDNDGKVRYRGVKYRGEAYVAGSAVYLKPKSIYFKYPMIKKPRSSDKKVLDESLFPEHFRKILQPKTNLLLDTSATLDIGYIKEIVVCSDKLSLRVKKLYRPENTLRSSSLNRKSDFNMLFWSHEECTIPFEYVIGKCYLTHEKNVEDIGDWSRKGSDRFYFSQVYEETKLYRVDNHKYLGARETHEIPRDLTGVTKLATLDIFAGCGGLSHGLQQAGIADTCWAIECDPAAAATYKLNSPHTAVFVEDCNVFLKKVLKGETKLDFQILPCRGDVQLLCTTLPRRSLRAIDSVSAFKSSSVATFVSFCDYYRPLIFVIEADEKLVKNSLILKLTLACFVNMGYQVSFDLMQVGCYGVPQNCRRSVILGAAPGQKLPLHPKHLHSLPKTLSTSGIIVDGKKYKRPSGWVDFAPYRCVTVQDAIEDLVIMKTQSSEDYCGDTETCYQRMMRSGMLEPTLTDHVWKVMDSLVQSRIARIPLDKNSNWCDLPNIQVELENGRVTDKLKYPYEIQTPTGVRRGVCKCSQGEQCDPREKQDGCLIPWHLAHSADDLNEHWSSLYARIAWDGLSSGGLTNPEPLGEEGPVLHSSQHRVVSVRECARLQGFADDFLFDKNLSIYDKYRLIGEATSPLFALAIGREITRCLSLQRSK